MSRSEGALLHSLVNTTRDWCKLEMFIAVCYAPTPPPNLAPINTLPSPTAPFRYQEVSSTTDHMWWNVSLSWLRLAIWQILQQILTYILLRKAFFSAVFIFSSVDRDWWRLLMANFRSAHRSTFDCKGEKCPFFKLVRYAGVFTVLTVGEHGVGWDTLFHVFFSKWI